MPLPILTPGDFVMVGAGLLLMAALLFWTAALPVLGLLWLVGVL